MDSLQAKLLEKLEQSLVDLQLSPEDLSCGSVDSSDPSEQRNTSKPVPTTAHEVSYNKHSHTFSYLSVFVLKTDSHKYIAHVAGIHGT